MTETKLKKSVLELKLRNKNGILFEPVLRFLF